MRRLKPFWNLVSHGSTAWGLLPSSWQAAFGLGLSAVTGYFGTSAGGIAWGIFLATGVFAFCMVGLHAAMRLARATTVFQHLAVTGVGILDAGLRLNEADRSFEMTHVTLQCALKNESAQTLYCRTKRCFHSFMGKTSDSSVPEQVAVLPSATEQHFVFATINDLGIKMGGGAGPVSPKGRIELEIEYGSRADDLKYLLEYVVEPSVGVVVSFEGKQADLKVVPSVKTFRHQRRTWG